MVADDPGRPFVFGRNALEYERARPTYPDEAIAHIVGLVDPASAVEVGAGTGKATEAVAKEGLRLICLEPSADMADVLGAKALPGVTVEVTTFEDWGGPPDPVDLIYAAQAWHWVDPNTAYEKALSALRPGGALALLWNIPYDRYIRHRQLYARYAPHLLGEGDQRVKRRDQHDWGADMEAAGFVDLDRLTLRWDDTLTADHYRGLHASYSDHIMLPEPDRSRLLDGLQAEVEAWGGTATIEYRTEVFSGRKPVTGAN